MKYTDYKASRDLAWEILIREKITELPVRTGKLCSQLGVPIKLCEMKASGRTTLVQGVPTVLLNETEPPLRRKFTCAHELGHILLKHTDKFGVAYRDPEPTDDPKEQAANVFAARLLAPAIVLRDLGVTNAEQIAELCQISQTAAEYRMDRLQELYDREKRFLIDRGRSCFGMSPLERKVERQFKKYIKKNKL